MNPVQAYAQAPIRRVLVAIVLFAGVTVIHFNRSADAQEYSAVERPISSATPEAAALAKQAVAGSLTGQTSAVLAESLSAAVSNGSIQSVASLDTVADPLFDVMDGRADIGAAGVDADVSGTVVVGLVVDIYADPFTDPAWVFGVTGASWEFDVNLDGFSDFRARFFNIGGSLVGAIFDDASNIVCPIDPFADAGNSGYGATFDVNCIGNPERFGWFAEMGYDGAIWGWEVDWAPDSTWAGPATNGFYNPPVATTTTTVPATTVPSNPGSASNLIPVVPARLLESRPGESTADGLFAGIGRRSAGSVTELAVTGRGGVPAGADAVLLNVTAVFPDAPGFLTVYPCGQQRPNASNVNYAPGDVVPNAVLAKVGVGGTVCIYTLAATDLIADVNGYVD